MASVIRLIGAYTPPNSEDEPEDEPENEPEDEPEGTIAQEYEVRLE